MRSSGFFPSLILLALAGGISCAVAEDGAIVIDTVPVLLDDRDPNARAVGQLRYRAGFHLTSGAEAFGGFSGLTLGSDGRLLAVSDRGHWLEAELRFAADGTLEGLAAARMGPLPDDDGQPVEGRARRDAEEVQELAGRGFLVSFEGAHRLRLYSTASADGSPLAVRPRAFPFPGDVHRSDANKGMEAVTVLADGRILTFAEEADGNGFPGWIGAPDGSSWEPLSLPAFEDFQVTGAATLPSGDVVLIERNYSVEQGFNRVRLVRIAAPSIVAGARLEPAPLALLEPPLVVDNMEAVAVHEGPAGEVLVYLLSDDNYSDTQRTLLLQFELAG